MRGSRLDERTTQRLRKGVTDEPPGAVLSHLAGSSGDYVLVALAAALGIIGWPKPVGVCFHFLEDEPVVVEGTERYDRVLIDLLERWTLLVEAVGLVVEAGWGLPELAGREMSVRALEVRRWPLGDGGSSGGEAKGAHLIRLGRLGVEGEGDGRDEEGANSQRQEGNLGGFHGAC